MRADASPAHVFATDLGPPGSRLTLAPDESHYVARVIRARPGDLLTATNGRGARASVEVVSAGRDVDVVVRALEQVPRPGPIALWCGAPEGDRADWLVEKLAELGVSEFQPVDTERVSWSRFDARQGRWQRLALAGLKQSQQAWRLEIKPPRALADLLAAPRAAVACYVGSPAGQRAADLRPPVGPVIGAIGPSSGFSEPELEALSRCDFKPVRFGAQRLRTETAALAMGVWWASQEA